MSLSKPKRRYLMLIWLLISIPVVLLFLVLMNNQANLLQSPGFTTRLKIFITSNQAEIKRQPVLPELQSPHFKTSPAELFQKVLLAVNELGWQTLGNDPVNYQLQAVVTTSLWKFKDDIDIKILAEGDGCYLTAISRSRTGRGDFAANSHHLQQLLARLNDPDVVEE